MAQAGRVAGRVSTWAGTDVGEGRQLHAGRGVNTGRWGGHIGVPAGQPDTGVDTGVSARVQCRGCRHGQVGGVDTGR